MKLTGYKRIIYGLIQDGDGVTYSDIAKFLYGEDSIRRRGSLKVMMHHLRAILKVNGQDFYTVGKCRHGVTFYPTTKKDK